MSLCRFGALARPGPAIRVCFATAIAVLWLNMIAFTFPFSGFGAEFLAWLRKRESWRVLYPLYIGLYTIFSFSRTFAVFSHHVAAAGKAGMPRSEVLLFLRLSALLLFLLTSLGLAMTAGIVKN